MKAYFDTNVLIPALLKGEPNSRSSFQLLSRAASGRLHGHISAHGVTEIYSVLTRVRWRESVTPTDALLMIERTVKPHLTVIDVRSSAYYAALAVCAKSGWRGGRIHDAVHVQAAAQAECDVIYTYDVAHFLSVAGDWAGRIEEPPEL